MIGKDYTLFWHLGAHRPCHLNPFVLEVSNPWIDIIWIYHELADSNLQETTRAKNCYRECFGRFWNWRIPEVSKCLVLRCTYLQSLPVLRCPKPVINHCMIALAIILTLDMASHHLTSGVFLDGRHRLRYSQKSCSWERIHWRSTELSCGQERSCRKTHRKESKWWDDRMNEQQNSVLNTIWLFNIAMENHHF